MVECMCMGMKLFDIAKAPCSHPLRGYLRLIAVTHSVTPALQVSSTSPVELVAGFTSGSVSIVGVFCLGDGKSYADPCEREKSEWECESHLREEGWGQESAIPEESRRSCIRYKDFRVFGC